MLQESPVTESNDIKKVTEEDIEIDLEFNSKLFLDIIDRMQLLKNHLQLSGHPINLCIAFMVQVTVDLENVNLDLLEKYGFKFTKNETHCFINLKAFSDSGADDCKIS